MKFLWQAAGYTLLDHKRNEKILEELKMDCMEETFYTSTNNCPGHRLLKQIVKYHLTGRQ
jgi:hypothetical protein